MSFVDRVQEMDRILHALKAAKTGEGQLLLVRGEVGSGKTRLLHEGATEAERQGFTIGFGTAFAESVVPYHAWKEVLEGLGLETILEEAPPPKLLGLYLIASDGGIRIKVEREGTDTRLAPLVDMIAESVRKSESQQVNDEEETISHDHYRSVVERRPNSSLGAIVEGQEDEAFLVDLKELADTAESMLGDTQHVGVDDAIEAPMRELLGSEKYEGIDYTKDDPKLRQAKLFEHVTLGLSRKAKVRSLCVVIDDLQWADPSSLALLHYVARNTHKTGVLLLGTYRTEEAEARPHLRDALKGTEQEELLAEMDLKGLSREDLGDLAESFPGSHDLLDDFLDLFWQETQGNPLFVREVLRGLEEDEVIAVRGAVKRLLRPLDQVALPERVREVIQTRLDRLPKGDRRLLDAAATCGTRFTSALVAKVAGEAEGKVLNGLNAIAKVHGLLRPTDSGFTFDHPTVQEVLYNGVPTETRQNYHKEAAEWLELAGGPIEDVAEHLYRAKDPRAAQRLRQVAEVALKKFANKEAIRFCQEALEVEEDESKKAETMEDLGDVNDLIGEWDTSIQCYERALELTEETTQAAEIEAKMGGVFRKKGKFDESTASSQRALDLTEDVDCRGKAKALYNIGLVHFIKEGRSGSSPEYFKRALEVGERIGDLQIMAESFNGLGNFHRDSGGDRALEYFQKSARIRREIGDQGGLSGTLSNIGSFYFVRGEYKRALEYYQNALDISERIGYLDFVARHLDNIGIVLAVTGQFDRALEHLEKGLEITERIGHVRGTWNSHDNIGRVNLDMGRYDEAFEHFEAGLKIGEEIGDQVGVAVSHSSIGEVCLKKREYDEALEHFEASLSTTKDSFRRYSLDNYCGLAEARYGKTDFTKALRFCERAIELANEFDSKEHIAISKFISGMTYREQGKWEESAEDFGTSIDIYSSLGQPLGEARSHFEFAKMWKARGNASEARKHLSKAIEMFESLNLDKELTEAKTAYETVQTRPRS
ncbi:MAG: tetratricopeptide repeat protein [Candidatus Thermoplasmatota archaeon]|nr:tetratricopeptide repeat protein [Candidatus Thermoplasmatota archaeon]